MAQKQLKFKKNIKASLSIGDTLIVPYNNSEVFADMEKNEIFILIKNKTDESKNIKIFFKDTDEVQFDEVVNEDNNSIPEK